jgi:hypothetical protein
MAPLGSGFMRDILEQKAVEDAPELVPTDYEEGEDTDS